MKTFKQYAVITKDKKAIVVENTQYENNRPVKSCKTKGAAHELATKLLEGAGFQGWTPDFFLDKKKKAK